MTLWSAVLFGKLAGVGMHIQMPRNAAPWVLAIVLTGLVTYFGWYFPRARILVRRWAERNGFELLDLEHRFLFKGPFFWNHSKYQPVFRVRVRDRRGDEHLGWVRCGGSLIGVFADETSVIWDKERDS